MGLFRDVVESVRSPHLRRVFFRSLSFNRRLILWYANRLVRPESQIETTERLHTIDELRKKGRSFTFISNHLTYADSHIIEVLLIRFGFADLARHIIHIAGQKTFDFSRRFFTRSLNTVRVYQPKARINKEFKKRMNARALKWAAHLKRRGYSVLVYPEGTRTRKHRTFNLTSANPRTIIFFRHSSVIPVALMGAEKIMPVGKILQNRAAVQLRIGEPIDHSQLEAQFRKENPHHTDFQLNQELISHYMNKINDLLNPEYRFDLSSLIRQ